MGAGICQIGAIQRRQFHLTVSSADAAFVSRNFRVPAYVDDAANPASIFDHHRGIIFHGVVMHDVGELRGDPKRLAEKEIKKPSMRCDATSNRGPPPALKGSTSQLRLPFPSNHAWEVKLSQNRSADRAGCEQMLRALRLGIAPAVISYAQNLAGLGDGFHCIITRASASLMKAFMGFSHNTCLPERSA